MLARVISFEILFLAAGCVLLVGIAYRFWKMSLCKAYGQPQYLPWTWWFAWYPIMHKGKRIWLRWIQRRWHARRLGDGWYEYRCWYEYR
jgi:hypothetical protein